MSELKEIEVILAEAGSVGLRSKTIESAYNILQRNPNIDRVSAYKLAFETILINTDEPDERDLNVDEISYVDNEDGDIDIQDFKSEAKNKLFGDIDDLDESLEEGIS